LFDLAENFRNIAVLLQTYSVILSLYYDKYLWDMRCNSAVTGYRQFVLTAHK